MPAEGGALAVQLFESAAHILTLEQYKTFALPAQQKSFAALKGKVPTICFAHNWDDIKSLGEAGADVVSLPSSTTISAAREILGNKQGVQGNVSNHLLVSGSKEDIKKAVRACVQSGDTASAAATASAHPNGSHANKASTSMCASVSVGFTGRDRAASHGLDKDPVFSTGVRRDDTQPEAGGQYPITVRPYGMRTRACPNSASATSTVFL